MVSAAFPAKAPECTASGPPPGIRWYLVLLLIVPALLAACSGKTYRLSGTVTALKGSGLVLVNNGTDTLPISSNGPFSFDVDYPFSYPYLVTVKSQPRNPNQICAVFNAQGRLLKNVGDVQVLCVNTYVVSGTVTGLQAGGSVVIQDNNTDNTTLSANGSFRFAVEVLDGGTFNVTIATNPAGQLCQVVNGSGTIAGANHDNVQIDCGTQTVGGTVSGLFGQLVLRNNGGDDLTVQTNGAFTFATKIYAGARYAVTVATPPDGQICVVTNGTGTVPASGNVTGVQVNCGFTVGGTASGLLGPMTLQLNGGNDLQVQVDGAFVFGIGLNTGANYNVTVSSPPPGESCVVTGGGSGTILQTAVTTILVTCQVGPAVSASYDIKRLTLSWPPISNASSYNVFVSTAQPQSFGGAPIATINDPNTASFVVPLSVHLIDWPNLAYKVQSCVSGDCEDSNILSALSSAAATGYFKADDTAAGDQFGSAVAMAGNGTTFAVGAPLEDGGTDAAPVSDRGAVYIFSQDPNSGQWTQQTRLDGAAAGDRFGAAVALSRDGNTLVVGAPGRGNGAGAAYVFVRTGTTWAAGPTLLASNGEANDQFGAAVALSRQGNTLAVGATGESSSATGVNPANPAQADNGAANSGAVYVFVRNTGNGSWSQQAYVKASNTRVGDTFGTSLSLSDAGDTLAVGAPAQVDNAVNPNTGAVYVFAFDGTSWGQQSYLKVPINSVSSDLFGQSLALSGDGSALAVGAPGPDVDDANAFETGTVYTFTRGATTPPTWNPARTIDSGAAQNGDRFGSALSLSGDGKLLAIGMVGENGNAVGVNGNLNVSDPESGAVRVFSLSNGNWSEKTYVKASNTGPGDRFAQSVSLSEDGSALAVGAPFEDGSGEGVATGGGATDDAAEDAGAAYLY